MNGIERRALEMWRKREIQFPCFTRRMTPDEFDIASGAWSAIVEAARAATSALPETSIMEANGSQWTVDFASVHKVVAEEGLEPPTQGL